MRKAPHIAPAWRPHIDEIARSIAAGAEPVDRGDRDLAPEIALLADSGLLAAPCMSPAADGCWAAAGADDPLFKTLFALGRVSLPAARLYEGHVDALGLVWRNGTDEARRRAREQANAGQLFGVWGADAPDCPATAATDTDNSLRLSGAKAFASGLGLVKNAIVTVRDATGQIRMAIVDARDPARQNPAAWDMAGMVGSASGRFDLNGLVVQSSDQLGCAGDLFAEPYFHGGLWRICAVQAGALQGLAEALREHLQVRSQLDDPLQRQRLAHLVLSAGTARFWAEAAARAVASPVAAPAAIEVPLLAREAVEQAAIMGLDSCERAAGTALHSRSSIMGRLQRDLRLYLRQASLDSKLDTALGLWMQRQATSA